MKKLIDIIAGRVLTVSGFVTSIVILLIIGFLFTEAVGLFSNPVVEKGYVLAVNPANTVERLNAQQIKQIFDEEITNWKEVGGADAQIACIGREAGSGTRDGFESITETEGALKNISLPLFLPGNLI